jgi:hypothetical protein
MIDRLETAETLRGRARRTIVLAAAIASAGLAPLVDELVLGNAFGHGRMDAVPVLAFGAWGAVLAAAIGGATVHLSLRTDSAANVVWLSILAGIAYLPVLLGGALVPELADRGVDDLLSMLGGGLLITVVGAIVSGPAGFGFGLVFLAGLAPLRPSIDAPTHELPARAHYAAGGLFGAASASAFLLSLAMTGSYCQMIFFVLLPALGVEAPPGTDLAWTCFVVVPTPFVVLSLAALARGAWLDRRMRLTVAALRRGDHPRWTLATSTAGCARRELVPMREHDAERRPIAQAVLARDALTPYRDDGAAVTLLAPDA